MTRIRRRAPALAAALAPILAACVPIPRTATLAPTVVGSLMREDRTPVVGERLALSVAYEDSTCRSPELFTTVDTAGTFAFPAVTKRERWTPVLFEQLLCYSICGGEAGDPVYSACFLHSVPAADTLSCVTFDPPIAVGERRTRCLHRPRPRP